jgi:Ni/Co efflux regulator RcnB
MPLSRTESRPRFIKGKATMRLLALVALTASAAWIVPAAAQTVPDPNPYYGVSPDQNMPPPPRRRAAPPAGATWQAPPQQMQMRMEGPPPQAMPQQRNFVVRRIGPGPAMGPERRQMEYRRVERGGMVPERWRQPQVQVRNWRTYGFPQPFAGGRWIRYYDDALLIDGNGRVYDSRSDWDWDRYGERWDHDGDGVPVYAGDGGYRHDGRGAEWAERYERREAGPPPEVRQRVFVEHGPMGPPMGPPPPPYAYGYGGGYGGVVVTETTVTEAPVVEQRTYVRYETVRVPVRHRRHVVRRCTCRVAAPPPPPGGGERG